MLTLSRCSCFFGSQNCLHHASVCPLKCILSTTISRSANRCVVILCCLLAGSMLRNPNLESQLLSTYAELMIDLDKEIDDYAEHVCCSCERLHQRKNVTIVSLSDNLDSEVWPRLKNFITQNYPAATDQELFIYKYCKALVKKDKLPPRCVLNGLQTVPIPSKLSKLDSLSTQLIQRAKSYQTIFRLGTYIAEVPIYKFS